MKILCVADLHLRKPWFAWVRAQAGHFDAVCLAGDLLDMFVTDESGLRRQADWVLQWLARFPRVTPCHAVTGNHDIWVDQDHPEYHLGAWLQRARRVGVTVDGDLTTLGGYTLVCWPWFCSTTPSATGKVIVVAHAPPAGSNVACDGDCDLGDIDLRFYAEQLPAGSIVVSGHVHRPRRWISKVGAVTCINAGCDLNAAIPHHVVLDLARGHAELRRVGETTHVSPI